MSLERYLRIVRRIRMIRIDKGIKQSDVAKHLFITATAYNRMERGHTQITVRNLLLIAQALGIDVCDLIRERKPRRAAPNWDNFLD